METSRESEHRRGTRKKGEGKRGREGRERQREREQNGWGKNGEAWRTVKVQYLSPFHVSTVADLQQPKCEKEELERGCVCVCIHCIICVLGVCEFVCVGPH